jgi:glycosyltransferase involved in cell wall biosynthesis
LVAVHQVLPVLAPRDAIGNHTVAIRDVLRTMGVGGEIIAGEIVNGSSVGARTTRHVRPAKLAAAEPTIWLYHASTGSPVADWWAELPGPKAIDYHNISPAELVGPWEPHVGVELEHGRRQLAGLVDITGWALADSAYNEAELIGLGYRRTAVVPILLDTAHLADAPADEQLLSELRARKAADGGADLLFVSRVLPHKGQHDLVKALAAYRLAYDDAARLTLVGAVGSARYADALTDFVDELGLRDAVTVTGSVTPGQLTAHFRVADVYVSASAHEGFGVPLLEAMAHGVPVVAYGSSAVPETVGDAGVLLADRSATVMASAVDRVLRDDALRARLVAAGRRRLEQFGIGPSTERLRAALTRILSDAGLDR